MSEGPEDEGGQEGQELAPDGDSEQVKHVADSDAGSGDEAHGTG